METLFGVITLLLAYNLIKIALTEPKCFLIMAVGFCVTFSPVIYHIMTN